MILESRHVPLGALATVEVPAPEETEYRGRIILADTTKDAPLWGRVQAIGPGFQQTAEYELTPETVIRVGDAVLFGKYGGHQIELSSGRKLVYLADTDILGKLIPQGS